MAELFPDGDVRIGKEGDDYYLTATEISSPPNGQQPYEVAPAILNRVNGLARSIRPNDYQPVELVGRYQVGENHHHVLVTDNAGIRDQVTVVVGAATAEGRGRVTAAAIVTRNGELVTQPEPPGSKFLVLAAQNPDVGEALDVMGKASPTGWRCTRSTRSSATTSSLRR